MSLTTQNKEEWACGAGISNDKLWNPKCNFFALLFGFVVIQIRASSSHSYACSLSGTHICSSAVSCMCFHYFDLFNMCDEGKASRMLLWVHMNCVTLGACERMPACDGWRQLPCADCGDHACKHVISHSEYLLSALLFFRQGVWACCVQNGLAWR